jgi:hypothetical protein
MAGGASFPPTADEHTPREEELEAAVGDDIPKQLLNTSHAMTTSSKKSRKSQVRAGFREVHCQQPASVQGNSDDKASDCDAGQKAKRLPVYCTGADMNTEWAALTKYHISIVTSPTNHMSQGEATCDGIDAGQ